MVQNKNWMMLKSVAVFLAISVTLMELGHTHSLPDDQSPKAVKKWFKHRLPHAKQKLTKLHFYLHNTVSRNPPASAPVARANFTDASPTKFGLVNALDGPLTTHPTSKRIIGYSQGLLTFSSQEETSTLMTLNFVFTAGKYNGSTLSILGRNAVSRQYREFPIVGGSGDFRLAHGIGTASTYSNNATSGDDVLDISLVFYRYTVPDCGCD